MRARAKTVGALGCLALGLGLWACQAVDAPAPPTPAAVAADARARCAWPAFPADEAAAQALIAQHTRRPPGPALAPLDAETVRFGLERAIRAGEAQVGFETIVRQLGRRSLAAERAGRPVVLLLGNWHDAGLQFDALGHLVGPLGLRRLTAAGLEAFPADGCWGGLPADVQRGESATLERYGDAGAHIDLARLREQQRRYHYTAWKYGHLDRVLLVLGLAQAAGTPIHGCDMGADLQKRIEGLAEDTRLRLRELHCVFHLDEIRSPAGPRRVVLFWGDSHLAEDGLIRFLPADAEVLRIHLLGGRAASESLARTLGRRLALAEPVLFPLDGAQTQLVLLLPDSHLAAAFERTRDLLAERPAAGGPIGPGQVRVETQAPGTLFLPAAGAEVGPAGALFAVQPGQVPFYFQSPAGDLAGALFMPPDGFVELGLDPAGRKMETIEHTPNRPEKGR